MHVALLVIAHSPYVRRAARAPVAEERLHLTIAEGLIPLINLLWELHHARLDPRIGLACSPVLLEQLADPIVQKHFVIWMQSQQSKATQAATRWERESVGHQAYLARFYIDWSQHILEAFEQRFSRELAKELQALCTAGVAEPLAGTATHAYMPLLSRPESLRAQLEIGVLSVTQHLRRPKGLWLPGCGVRPDMPALIAAAGLRYVIVDPSTVVHDSVDAAHDQHQPTWLIDHQLAALPLNHEAGLHIWSSDVGYWGDPLYRDARRDVQSGLACWARGADGAAPYDPYHAFRRAQEHASHYVSVLSQMAHQGVKGVLVPLDLQLIGGDWFEGMMWLRSVLMQCSHHPDIKLVTPRALVRNLQPQQQSRLRSGSWGPGGDHRAWQGAATSNYWRDIHAAERQLSEVAAATVPSRLHERLLNQALRELLLAQASDWPQILSVDSDDTDAISRWRIHLRRFGILLDLFEHTSNDNTDLAVLEQIEEQDNPFPNLNYRIFTS